MTADDSIKCRCANSGMTGQVGGFQNPGICLQAFPSFLPHPLPALSLTPFFTRSLTLVPSSLLLNRTETLATQARGNLEMAYSALTMYDHNIGCCNNERFLSPKCDNFSGALSSKYSLEDFKNCDFCALSP